jgi:serine protease Do
LQEKATDLICSRFFDSSLLKGVSDMFGFEPGFWKLSVAQPGFHRGLAAGILVALLAVAGCLSFYTGVEARGSASAPVTVAATPGLVSAADLGRAFADVAKRVEPAVVNINTEQVIQGIPDPFEEFFGLRRAPRTYKQASLGSGFIIDPQGLVLTNYHVVEKASRINVKLDSGRVLDARVVGTDPQTDLAVLKIHASNVPYLRLADSNRAEVGDWVLAFGSPFGLQKTMTAGIISAKGRVIGAGPYDNFLQTDAAINRGNSGGPLVNLQGEVVGINTLILSEGGGWEGVGFAIPSSTASGVYQQLARSGKVSHGWLGISLDEVTPSLARRFGLREDARGALITEVVPGSPAARAGVHPGDVIVTIDGQGVQSGRDVSLVVADAKPGSPLRLGLLREGRRIALDVRLGERPADLAER